MSASPNLPSNPLGPLPNSVQVGPIKYTVVMEHDLKDDEGTTLFGRVSFAQCLVSVDDGLTLPMQWQCLWHEIMHIVFDQVGAQQSESLVDSVAYKMLEIMLDNGFLKFPQETQFPATETPEIDAAAFLKD